MNALMVVIWPVWMVLILITRAHRDCPYMYYKGPYRLSLYLLQRPIQCPYIYYRVDIDCPYIDYKGPCCWSLH